SVPDFDDIDDRQHHRMTRYITADVIAAGYFGMKIFDQTGLGGGAAHVERNYMPAVELLTEVGRGNNTGHRARFHHRYWHLFRRLCGHHSTVGLHDPKCPVKTAVAKRLLQREKIPIDDRPDIRIQ